MLKDKNFKKLLSIFWKYKKYIFIYFIFGAINAVIGFFTPYFGAKLLTNITLGNYKLIVYYALLSFSFSLVLYLLNAYSGIISLKFTSYVEREIKNNAINRLFDLKVVNFDKYGTGKFADIIDTEVGRLSYILITVMEYIIEIFQGLGTFIYLGVISLPIAIVLFLFSIINFVISKTKFKKTKKLLEIYNQKNENYRGFFTEVIRGMRDIKVLNIKKGVINEAILRNNDSTAADLDHQKLWSIYAIISNFYHSFKDTAIILFAAYLAYVKSISLANLLIIYQYRNRGSYFFSSMIDCYDHIKKFKISFDRFYSLTDTKLYSVEEYGSCSDDMNGDIEIRDLYFSYNKKKKVLKGVNLSIKKNTTVGIVGKSGEGKSTIMNLLSKLYEVPDNSIFIDGKDINDYSEKSIRENISVITQNPYIFNMSIKDNLRLVKADIKLKEIKEVCKKACLSDFIESLPEKYNTVIGENGVTLSGGQRQRLAIARALIQDAKIVIMDEATSALDNETQAEIQKTIKNLGKNKTLIIVAHRLSTIIDADNIFLINDGKVVSSGKHKELMKNCAEYNSLYKRELK